jgi:hypothetical protein
LALRGVSSSPLAHGFYQTLAPRVKAAGGYLVVQQPFGVVRKNEHQAVVLRTAHGPLKLRRPGGKPFRDPEREELAGREIVCEGEIHQGQLLMTRWNVVTSA